jgi:hypothetical protein
MKRATEYVLDPAHKDEVLATIPADGNAAAAERIYEMLTNESSGGLIRNLNLDGEGLLATANLRQTWGGWDTPQDLKWLVSSKSGISDPSYLEEAREFAR